MRVNSLSQELDAAQPELARGPPDATTECLPLDNDATVFFTVKNLPLIKILSEWFNFSSTKFWPNTDFFVVAWIQ